VEPVSEITVHHGDSRDVLKGLADASVHAVVCDPPYALVSIGKRFGADNAAASKPGKTGAYARASAGFMGQKWDTGETAFAVEFWAEVYRVLKPGGHVVAFSGTRTYHRLACAVEDAGFEIRDMVAWLYGSGFPKSHDVSKGIDKRRNWDALPRLQGAIREARLAIGISQSEAARRMGLIASDETLGGGGFMWFETGMRAPTREQWPALKLALSLSDDFDTCFEEVEREITGTVEAWTNRSNYALTSKDGMRRDKPASELARQWEGWGTALKPALEPIVFARKPLDGTVAANVLAHGVGALNIDACRIGTGEDKGVWPITQRRHDDVAFTPPPTLTDTTKGRWPANVIHDGSPEVVEAFPANAGAFAPVRGTEPSNAITNVYGDRTRVATQHHGDSGSAARFFYSAKADAEDRLGSKHPTVKPIDLMAWLCRLVTPPGGVILDPFAGTGTTGLAAMREGFDCILIEREAQYVADINRRLAWARGEGRLTAQETGKAKAEAIEDLPLFAPSEGLTPIGPVVAKVAAQVLDKALERDQDQGEAA
jgi:site-specific DNA-methyltransferase (adenine-specific)